MTIVYARSNDSQPDFPRSQGLETNVFRQCSRKFATVREDKLRCIAMFFIPLCCVSLLLSTLVLGGGDLFESPGPSFPRTVTSSANEHPRPNFTFPKDNERLEHYAGIWYDFEYDTARSTSAKRELCHVARRTKPKSCHTILDEVQLLTRKDLEDCRAKSPYCED